MQAYLWASESFGICQLWYMSAAESNQLSPMRLSLCLPLPPLPPLSHPVARPAAVSSIESVAYPRAAGTNASTNRKSFTAHPSPLTPGSETREAMAGIPRGGGVGRCSQGDRRGYCVRGRMSRGSGDARPPLATHRCGCAKRPLSAAPPTPAPALAFGVQGSGFRV